jgi:hypothetical protein
VSLEITVKAFLAGYTISETPSVWRDRTAGNFPLQALEVVTALSQVVFHGLSDQSKKPGRKRRTAIRVKPARIIAEAIGAIALSLANLTFVK